MHSGIGIYPFWFWNARLEPAEIDWQVAQMAAQGVRGFYLHSRQGMQQPYLSEAFFTMVDHAIAAAERHGLEVHLYDEFPYPTGAAGGETMLGDPAHMGTRLVDWRRDVGGGEPLRLVLPAGQVLHVVAYPRSADGTVNWQAGRDLRSQVGMSFQENTFSEMGLTPYNRKRFLACRPAPTLETTLPPGGWRIYGAVQAVTQGMKYWGAYIDALNPATIRRFLDLTYEPYAARYGDRFGGTIKSIFVDEIGPGWSRTLPAAFEARYGRALGPLLPALLDATHPQHLRVKAELRALQLDLFRTAFDLPVHAWCQSHGLMLAVEKPAWRLSQLRDSDLPGCDCGHTKAGKPLAILGDQPRDNVKAVASAAFFYDKPGSMDECFHSLGWSGTLQDAKLMAEGMVMLGITHLVPHGFFYSTHGLAKHDAPPSFYFQMPYWPFWGRLSARLDRIGEAWRGTHEDVELLVVEPASGLPTALGLRAFVALQNWLMDRHLGFLLVDTDTLETATIMPPGDGATSTGGALSVHGLTIRAIVVPPMPLIEAPLVARLDAFAAAGVCVVRLPEPPPDVAGDDVANTDPANLANQANLANLASATPASPAVGGTTAPIAPPCRLFDRDALQATLSRCVAPHLSVVDRPTGQEAAGVYAVRRIADASGATPPRYMILNTTAWPRDLMLRARGRCLREVPLDPDLPVRLLAGPVAGGFVREVAPFESVLLEETASQHGSVSPESGEGHAMLPVIAVPLDGIAELQPLHANLLRLAEFDLAILDDDGNVGDCARVPAMTLMHQLRKGRLRFAPVLHQDFGTPADLSLPVLHLRYSTEFAAASDWLGPVELVVEPGSIVGAWTLQLNDGPVLTADDLRPTTTHVRGSLGLDLTPWLARNTTAGDGQNRLVIHVRTDRPDGGLLNPLYLAGSFGVELAPVPRLTAPQRRGRFDAWRANRLPYYAGSLEYRRTVHLALPPESSASPADTDVLLRLESTGPCHDALEVAVTPVSASPTTAPGPLVWHPVLWEPRLLRLPRTALGDGQVSLHLRVHTTLIRAFEGEYFDERQHRGRPVTDEPA